MRRKRKQRSKLIRIMEASERNEYTTTKKDCLYWFKIINRELFEDQLPPFTHIDVRWRRNQTHAFYKSLHYGSGKNREIVSTQLCMNKKYPSKQFFITVLAHEMIHHFQFFNEERLGHGKSFTRWTKHFKQKGLTVARAYNAHEEI